MSQNEVALSDGSSKLVLSSERAFCGADVTVSAPTSRGSKKLNVCLFCLVLAQQFSRQLETTPGVCEPGSLREASVGGVVHFCKAEVQQ